MPCVEMKPGLLPEGLNAFAQYQVYNCLDSAVTAQLTPVMKEIAEPQHLRAYHRSMWVQSLCLEISVKGLPVNKMDMLCLVQELDREAEKAKRILDLFTAAVWAPPLNPNSWQQVETFFYDFLKLPPEWQYDHKTKQRKRGSNRDALEKLRDKYPSCSPFVNAIFAYREAVKLAGVFKKGLEADGRLRCSVSPTGTKTRRLSSQTNPFGRGTNAQNLNDRVRKVVSPDSSHLLAYVDLKTAESFAVGFISGDRAYIEACSSGDLHTAVAKMTWLDLPWIGDLKKDKAVAENPFYRDFSYRDMAKRGGHGTNYYGTPPTMAKHLKVDTQIMRDFQSKYLTAFPGISEWHLRVIAQIQQTGVIRNVFGIERMFWGRRDDPSTHREAIAHEPQGTVAEIMNQGLIQVQDWLIRNGEEQNVELLMQVHDAGLFILPRDGYEDYLRMILREIVVPVEYRGMGTMLIPADASIGKNWGKAKFDKNKQAWKNPNGLRDWTPGMKLWF